MLGNGLLYVPVVDEDETPIDVVSLRDLTFFLARESAN